MKRLFTLILSIIAFWGNAMADEPVKIKEKHWFGEHEFYDAPLIGHEDKTGKIKDNTFQWIGNWTLDASSQYHDQGNGKIGVYKVVNVNTVSEATADDQHAPLVNGQRKEEYCIGLEARWNYSYVSYYQTTEELPAGTYALTYDVMNGNSASTNASYENRFYVEVNGTKTYDPRTEWMSGGTKWTTHTIVFTLNSASQVKINLGFGMGTNNIPQENSPALYVSHLKLEQVNSTIDTETHINWSDNFIESINVVKDWTGKVGDERQRPKRSFYSWLDHKLRFSVDDKSKWYLGRNGKHENVLGLMNMSGNDAQFTIHDLKAGDRFNIEYYRHAVEVNANGTISPSLVSGSVAEVSPGGSIYGADANGLVYYTMSGNGDVTVKIPHNTLIRSITIEHNDYKKATFTTEPITVEGKKGYKTTMTDSGVLEEKFGAIPYLTMRYGALSDMTVVRDLGNGEFAASCVINENNNFKPGDDGAKFMLPHRNMTEEHLKDWFAGKDWSVFTADLEQNDDGNWQNNQTSLLPLYGSYYYFFPEVNGKLKVRFYCEGENELMPFWDKTTGWFGLESQNSDGSNIYEYEGTVSKGHVYYLCSNPNNINHEHNVIRLISYSFVPDFSVEPLYKVVNNTTDIANGSEAITKAAEINGGFSGMNGEITGTYERNKDVVAKVKCLGNVKSATATIYEEGGKQYLGFSDITFRDGTNANGEAYNHGGAIVAYVDCEYGEASFVLTIAYDAANAKWGIDKTTDNKDARVAASAGGTEVKRWDFFTGKGDYDFDTGKRTSDWELGKYVEDDGTRYDENDDSWKGKSLLYREIHKADGLKADWENTYIDVANSNEPIFKSVYDMEGDNADMIRETAGLVFHTDGGQLGIFNENPTSTDEFQDRYIGFIGGGEMWIPNLEAGDRIVMKMGRYGKDSQGADKAHLTITGAKDAIGTDITGDYVIGGSGVATGNDLNNGADITDPSQPWGEYHFISTGGHFKLKVTDATLLKLYSIVIYKHDDTILTENELLGDEGHRQILNTEEFVTPDNVLLRLHYRGLKEATNYSAPVEAKTGNLVKSDVHVSNQTSYESLWYTYSVDLPESPADAKFGVFKARQGVKTIGEDYVTDYADCMIPVGYRETMTYPYTWDFTDLKKYVSAGINNNGVENEVVDADADLRIWNNWNLRVKPDEWDGNIFVSGGQLYGGKTMFDETRGIGITHDNTNVVSMTGTTTDETGGLSIGDGAYGFIVPQVGKNEAIYVRAHKVGNTQKTKYEQSDGTTTYAYGNSEQDFPYSETATDGTNDEVFAVVMPSSLTKKVDVKLSFKGYEVKKIAVSTDPKSVNSYGYSTECRAHDIDHRLTPYFSAGNIKAYRVSDVNYDESKIVLAEVDKILPAASANGDAGLGVILYNTKAGEDKSSDFHLFVPDMHDKDNNDLKLSAESNKLYANLTQNNSIGANPGDYTNYLLNAKGTNPVNGKTVEGIAFYRASKTAKLGPNKAYLPILTSAVQPSTGNLGGAKMQIVFVDADDAEDDATVTAVTGIEVNNAAEENSYYTLSGIKIDRPTKRGMYIKNGKKIIIK